MADQLANHLRKLGVGRAKIVGILMEKCLEHVVAQIAILKAGNSDVSFVKIMSHL